jgi:hypothetical protein
MFSNMDLMLLILRVRDYISLSLEFNSSPPLEWN